MADNVPITAGLGTDIATDQVTGTGEHVQVVKLAYGADGLRTPIPADASGLLVTVNGAASLPLPSGAATAALQTTGNTSVGSIDTKTPALGQALAAGSVPVVLPAAQITTLTPPAAITGYSTEATLALIKAKTDNLDVLLSTRTKPADAQHVIVDSSASVAVTGPLTDTQIRATALPVSGTFWQATQPVSGTVTANAGTGTLAVSGPLTDTQLRATAVPVSDAASSLTVDAPVGTPLFARLSDGAAALVGQKVMASSLPIAIASDQSAVPVMHAPSGGTNVLKTGTITTTAVTADQVVLTYTVTALKTFYFSFLTMYGRLTAPSATASILGAISLETPSGTKVLTLDDMNPTTSELEFNPFLFPEPFPIAAGVVIRVVVTPAATTSMLWRANLGGYEK